MTQKIRATVADDEPLLLNTLVRTLAAVWPDCEIVGTAANGTQALNSILLHKPDVAFLDIKMPGQSGIDVAHIIAEDWDDSPPPLIVFVTAHGDFAVDAFAAAAFDYLLKPVTVERLQQTVARIQTLAGKQVHPDIDQLGNQIRALLETSATHTGDELKPAPLRVVRANRGDTVEMIPVEDVVLFESADKYVTVSSSNNEVLIREPLRKLLPQLDSGLFAQIHRGAIVNLSKVESALRDDTGKITLRLKGIDKQPVVSRMYRHLFQAM